MLTIRRLTADDLGLVRPFADRALVGEAVHLKISRLGFQLDYLPLPKAEWRTYLPVEFADPAIIAQDDASAFFAARRHFSSSSPWFFGPKHTSFSTVVSKS